MTPEERQLLIETRDLAQENAKILKSIQRATRASLAIKVIYWVIILGLTFGAYFFIQPYLEFMMGALGSSPSPTGSHTVQDSLRELQSLYK
jgi:hypothetical protein